MIFDHRKMPAAAFAFFILALAALSTSAAEWVRLQDGELATSYYDKASIQRNGDLAKLWLLFDYKSPQSDAEMTFNSTRSLLELDCKEQRTRGRSVIFYSGAIASGKASSSERFIGPWMMIAPNTFNAIAWGVACGEIK